MNQEPSKILVVDDLMENRLVLQAVLGSYLEECQVVAVASAKEALQAIQLERFNCALLDLHMPGMDGITLCQQLQKASGRHRLPVILMTAHYANSELRARGIQAGANDFIVKPVDNAELVAKVKNILSDSRDRDSLRDSNRLLEEMVRERTAALHQSEGRLRAILDNIPSLVFLKDLQGRMMLVNQAWQRATGHSEAWVVGKTSFDLYPPAIAQQLHEENRMVLLSGEMLESEIWLPHGQGDRLYQVSKFPLRDEEGEIYAICGIATDITVRRQMEMESQRLAEMLRQRQKLDSIGTLTGGIAHDFNNILAIITGNAELATMDSQCSTHALETISEAARRGKMLIQQLLAFSRQAPVKRVALAPVKVVEEVLTLLRSTLPPHVCMEEYFVQPQDRILADATRLHQVVMNLCTNAVQAMGEKGGVIQVSLGPKNLTSKEAAILGVTAGAFVELTVRDEGCGIGPEVKERIFEPFFTTREKCGGTGLGLSVVHGVVRDCQGGILCESVPGQGTTFHLYFPLFQGEEAAENQAVDVTASGRGKGHILFVDDEQALVHIGRKILLSLGYEVTCATHPEQAWELFQQQMEAIDVVITDQVMPAMSGIALAQRMLAVRPTLPIILCSGYHDAAAVERNEGIRHTLAKPVARAEFARVLKEVFP